MNSIVSKPRLFILQKCNWSILIILVSGIMISCDNKINEPEMSGYVKLTVNTDEPAEIIYDDIIFYAVADSNLVEIINPTEVGVHHIQFSVPKDSVVHNHNFFVEDTLSIVILYFTPTNFQYPFKVYEFNTYTTIKF